MFCQQEKVLKIVISTYTPILVQIVWVEAKIAVFGCSPVMISNSGWTSVRGPYPASVKFSEGYYLDHLAEATALLASRGECHVHDEKLHLIVCFEQVQIHPNYSD